MARGWPAAVTRAARRAEQREEEERLTGGPGRGKIKKLSLKFKTKMFSGSKIHQIFTRDR